MALGQHKIEFEALEGWDRLLNGAVKRMAPLTPHAFQKFRRRAG